MKSLSARLDEVAQRLERMSADVRLPVEEAAELVASMEGQRILAAGDRDKACVVLIPVPSNFAGKFPDADTHNHGHKPHMTVLFVKPDVNAGEASLILAVTRQVCKRFAPFRLVMDPQAGLQSFGPVPEKGEQALWIGGRSEPAGDVDRLHRALRMALADEGIECEDHKDFVPHVTWKFVANDANEGALRREDALVSDRFVDKPFSFDVRNVLVSLPSGDKVAMLNPSQPRS
jgi:2'-5' RNA ligase